MAFLSMKDSMLQSKNPLDFLGSSGLGFTYQREVVTSVTRETRFRKHSFNWSTMRSLQKL